MKRTPMALILCKAILPSYPSDLFFWVDMLPLGWSLSNELQCDIYIAPFAIFKQIYYV